MTTRSREHLHLADCPLTLEVLDALFAHRLERAAGIGYELTEHGTLVNWDRLLDSWLSSTEKATVRIAWGASAAERRGRLPQEVHGPMRRLFEELTR